MENIRENYSELQEKLITDLKENNAWIAQTIVTPKTCSSSKTLFKIKVFVGPKIWILLLLHRVKFWAVTDLPSLK